MIYVGLAYYIISGIQIYNGLEEDLILQIAKYLILVIFGNEFFRRITTKEITVFLLIGAFSIIINALVFPDRLGRSSGFYVNPNSAGYVCLLGYGLSYALGKRSTKITFQLIFSIAGFLTFSRTFLILWVLTNLISLKISTKNIRVLGIGVAVLLSIFIFGELLNIGGKRFDMFSAVLSSERSASSLQQDSRPETWAKFYDEIMDNPILGGGYGKFQKNGVHGQGSHNTYLLIIGESGIIPFVLFIVFCLYLLFSSYKIFGLDPSLFMGCIILVMYLLTTHNFFDSYVKISTTLFLFNKIRALQTGDRKVVQLS